ncbi:MAG: hypothetical protein ACI9OJ_001412 [Myxococcota bacterium]|jgi:hypothetical protein
MDSVCDANSGECVEVNNSGDTRDDADVCTTDDVCTEGVCGGAAVVCDPSDVVWFANVCDAATGECGSQQFSPDSTCDDGDVCTIGDLCDVAGACAGTVDDCDDDNPCSTEVCDPVVGCSYEFAALDTSCDDGIECTTASCASLQRTVSRRVTSLAGRPTRGPIVRCAANPI